MIKNLLCLAVVLASVPAHALAALTAEPTAEERVRIDRVLSRTPLIDGHNDLPWAIRNDHGGDLSAVDLTRDTRGLSPPLQTDIPRLREGRVGAQFWSVYVPATLPGAEAAEAVHEQIDLVRRIVAEHDDVLELAQTAADVERIHRAGRIASMIGMEGGEPINGKLAILRQFRAAGVLYMTLCHAHTTSWIDSATDEPEHGGLSPFGEEVVREMNRIGMLVDLSHVSAEAMRDALRVARAPVIFSHSSAFALVPHPRNVPDDVLRRMPDNGGVVMVNFYPGFVSEDVLHWSAARAAEEVRLSTFHPDDPEAVASALAEWSAAHPRPAATVAQVADHVEHVRDVAGIDHVGIGGDFDGIPFAPEGLEGVEAYPNLFAELLRRGWSDADLAKLAGGNLLRALRQAERIARGEP